MSVSARGMLMHLNRAVVQSGMIYMCVTCGEYGRAQAKCDCGKFFVRGELADALETAKMFAEEQMNPKHDMRGFDMFMVLLIADLSCGINGNTGEPCPKLKLSPENKAKLRKFVLGLFAKNSS